MKRGSKDDKAVGPMFPRLHVNDAEKGGPRAPPRNKMALYEQFSIPSQRFNPRLLPLNPNPSSNRVPPSTPSTQGNDHDRSYVYPVCLPSQTPSHRAESYINPQSDGPRSNTSSVQLKQRKKVDEDEIHAYIRSRVGQSNDKTLDIFKGKKFTSLGSRNLCCSVAVQNNGDKDLTQFGSVPVDTRKDVRSGNEVHPKVSSSRQQRKMSVKYKSSGEIIDSLVMQAKVIPNQEDQDYSVPNINRLYQDNACLQQECVAGAQSNDIEDGDVLLNSTSERDMDNGNALVPKGCFHSAVNQTHPLEATIDAEYHDTGTGGTIQKGNFDGNGDVSKISTVTNSSSLIVSPDDVVGILGQKHFWKARRQIANQQRVFAVQVFELHRLIKVQQLMAASPDVLLEDGAFIGNFPVTGSTPKNLSLEVVVEPRQQNNKRKNDSEKLNNKTECSAENAVGRKTSFSSPINGSHLTNHTPLTQHGANVTSDSRASPWCFNQSPGNQWLIPIMSPSEGLVYKPYPGPEFMGSMHGGCGGPYGQPPLGATFMNPAYQFPASHQVAGVSPFVPPSHAYFPPYGMPVMNQATSESAVEPVNQFALQGSLGQNGHSSVEGANFNTHHNQSSSNLPVQRNEVTLHVKRFQASKERQLQGSTTSGPSEMAQGISAGKIAEGSDAHSLPLHSVETRQQTQVIKVVPHNRKSATESAARIFQSIQEERKQHV